MPAPPTPIAPPVPFYHASPALIPMPPAPVVPPMVFYHVPPALMPAPPMVPAPSFGQAYSPGGGLPISNYALAPAQPYLAHYPPAQWPPYQQYYVGQQGAFDQDSEVT